MAAARGEALFSISIIIWRVIENSLIRNRALDNYNLSVTMKGKDSGSNKLPNNQKRQKRPGDGQCR
jgi:hypothetical protein